MKLHKKDFSKWQRVKENVLCLCEQLVVCVHVIVSFPGCSCDDVRTTAPSPLMDVGDLQSDGDERTEHHLQRGTYQNTCLTMIIRLFMKCHCCFVYCFSEYAVLCCTFNSFCNNIGIFDVF